MCWALLPTELDRRRTNASATLPMEESMAEKTFLTRDEQEIEKRGYWR